MFSFLNSLKRDYMKTSSSNPTLKKDRERSPVNLDASTQPKEEKPISPPKDTWVYIWNMTVNKVGHAAIQVGGSQPKMNEEDPGEYVSIHPDYLPSKGLTSVLPLPAHIAKSLSEDMESLGVFNNPGPFDIDTPLPVKPSQDSKPLEPNHIYHFKNLNTPEMSQLIRQTQEKVTIGEVGYQLLPNINLLGFFKNSSVFVSQDPIDVEMNRRISEKKINNNQVYNCTTLVSEILNEGGLPVRQSRVKPWGITPNGLSTELCNSVEFSVLA